MNILIFNFEYPPLGGGGGVATKQLAEHLSRHHDVHVITSRHGSLQREETVLGVHVHRVTVLGRRDLPTASLLSLLTFVPSALWRGLRVTRDTRFDVINAQFVVPSGVPAALLARWRRLPFVLSFIGGDLFDPTKGVSPHRHWYLRVLIRAVARQARVCTAISKDTKRRAQQLHGVTTKIVVTHLGIVPQDVPSVRRDELALPSDGLLLVSVGRLIPRKGYETLLRAVAKLKKRGVAARALIIGSGPLKHELSELAISLDIADRITLPGFVPEKRKLQMMRAANAYVSATEHEGFGIVFLEAMEAGLPVVATDTGGHVDFLEDGVNACLVPVGDAAALAAAMERVLTDKELRERMVRANREAVKEYYLEKTAAKFEDVLTQAAGS